MSIKESSSFGGYDSLISDQYNSLSRGRNFLVLLRSSQLVTRHHGTKPFCKKNFLLLTSTLPSGFKIARAWFIIFKSSTFVTETSCLTRESRLACINCKESINHRLSIFIAR